MKRLKTFESYVDSAQDDGLYVQMSELLSRAEALYFEITGENEIFGSPEDAINSLIEFNEMEDVQDLIDNIEELNNQVDEIESEEFYRDIEDDIEDDEEY